MSELVSMAHLARPVGAADSPAPSDIVYPYGLKIHLGAPELEALGLKEVPEAGSGLRLEALAVVTRTSTEDQDADGDVDSVDVEVQLTHLCIRDDAETENAVDRRDRALAKLWKPRKSSTG